jgi:hypothetical protein
MSAAALPSLAQAWARSLRVEVERHGPHARFIAGAASIAHHQLDFGLVFSVTALPAGAIEPDYLLGRDGPLLTPAGERTWNSLLTLAHELAESPQAPLGSFWAVVLHPAAIDAARAALPKPEGEKREAA